MSQSPQKRNRRTTKDISRLLLDQTEKGYTIEEFCARHRVSKQTYYSWQRKYGSSESLVAGFVPLNVPVFQGGAPVPFCEITTQSAASIRFYQPVDAKFIKALTLY